MSLYTEGLRRQPHPVAGEEPGHGAAGGKPMVAFLRRPVPRFAVEFLGMCAAMCVGGRVLSGAFFDGLGFETLAQRSLASAVLVIVVSLSLPMAVYMALRGHWWRHNLTMTASTVTVG